MSAAVFRRALGEDFERLHPMMQRRFGVGTEAGYGCVGRGVMTRIRRGPWWTVPFLALGAFRNIMFPDRGHDIPFRIDNWPYIDAYGRETVTFVRTMEIAPGRRRRFDATMIYSERAGRVVDYLGTHPLWLALLPLPGERPRARRCRSRPRHRRGAMADAPQTLGRLG